MDRYEYKTKMDEIKELIKKGETEEAIDYIESINWRKVRNVNALMKAAELYESLDKMEEAKELLQFAHERSPIGRMIIYHLALLSIKMNEYDEAKEYYDEFVEIAPHDSMKYLIKYQLNKAKHADDGTLIAILEELRDHDFLEEWSFELACLYHKTAQVDKCIDLCDEIILWFGDGIYVEKALELKMLYQPLDKQQEDKYRQFQQRKDGITEIRPGDMLESGEILHQPITIPSVELPPERFNTVNLQAEIKKNIDEIMRATEAGEVSENMENIKMLVEEIPYLQVNEEPIQDAREHLETEESINENLKNTFQEYLAEEYDGQISLFVPEKSETETQVKGQMTIEEVMGEWEKTRRAAEAALQDAQQQKLEFAKEKALKEANNIMDRLEGVIPKLDAGVTPTELLKEEYLQEQMGSEQEAEPQQMQMEQPQIESQQMQMEQPQTEESVEYAQIQEPIRSLEDEYAATIDPAEHFEIPKVPTGVGLEIPIVHVAGPHTIKGDKSIDVPAVTKSTQGKETKEWEPPVLGEPKSQSNMEEKGSVDVKEASKIVADVNAMLQNEIDRLFNESGEEVTLIEETTLVEEVVPAEEPMPEEEIVDEPTIEMPSVEDILAATQKEEAELQNQQEEESEDAVEILADTVAEEILAEEAETTDASDEIQAEEDIEIPEIQMPEDLFADEIAEETVVPEDLSQEADDVVLPEIEEIKLEDEEVAELVDEKVLENAISDEIPVMKLTPDEKAIFSYFMPISGMEGMICQVLTGARSRLTDGSKANRGNIIIQGTVGSGKTMMATNLVKVLQKEINKPNGNVGKIDGDKLNEKDIQKLFSKIEGGCLIIEKAGEITRETAVTLSLLMEKDTTGILVIIEDSRMGIERVMGLSAEFSKKFTEKITIPVFTIDELVNFGKTYVSDLGYVVDEMGVLAMYNRINLIQRLDHPTSLLEVRDIMDEAIDNAERGGLKGLFGKLGSKKYDDEGNLILREKDFEE